MFDLSGINVPSDFNAAISARGELNIVDCPGKQYSYDTSNGIDSIVYQVKNTLKTFEVESLFLWAFVVALVRHLKSAKFAFLFVVSKWYVI